jgi:hypothetical protein
LKSIEKLKTANWCPENWFAKVEAVLWIPYSNQQDPLRPVAHVINNYVHKCIAIETYTSVENAVICNFYSQSN